MAPPVWCPASRWSPVESVSGEQKPQPLISAPYLGAPGGRSAQFSSCTDFRGSGAPGPRVWLQDCRLGMFPRNPRAVRFPTTIRVHPYQDRALRRRKACGNFLRTGNGSHRLCLGKRVAAGGELRQKSPGSTPQGPRSGMSGSLPSEGVYEDIGVATAGEKDEAAGAAAAAVLEEEYDDVAEPEPEEGDAEEGALLSPTGGALHSQGLLTPQAGKEDPSSLCPRTC
ncbi:TPA: hypothetical protein BOS_23526 [Bos taurus]|nr:TPA: hypothetical protein BOS_23526 [Bos taurus]